MSKWCATGSKRIDNLAPYSNSYLWKAVPQVQPASPSKQLDREPRYQDEVKEVLATTFEGERRDTAVR